MIDWFNEGIQASVDLETIFEVMQRPQISAPFVRQKRRTTSFMRRTIKRRRATVAHTVVDTVADTMVDTVADTVVDAVAGTEVDTVAGTEVDTVAGTEGPSQITGSQPDGASSNKINNINNMNTININSTNNINNISRRLLVFVRAAV